MPAIVRTGPKSETGPTADKDDVLRVAAVAKERTPGDRPLAVLA